MKFQIKAIIILSSFLTSPWSNMTSFVAATPPPSASPSESPSTSSPSTSSPSTSSPSTSSPTTSSPTTSSPTTSSPTTSSPSLRPSSSPSVTSSASPSDFPSVMPSSSPSMTPSASPSDFPSAMPSSSPSDFPSASPSAAPTVCNELGSDLFTFKYQYADDGVTIIGAVKKSCAWLKKNEGKFLHKKTCSTANDKRWGDFGPASGVCCDTCEICEQKTFTKFVIAAKVTGGGTGGGGGGNGGGTGGGGGGNGNGGGGNGNGNGGGKPKVNIFGKARDLKVVLTKRSCSVLQKAKPFLQSKWCGMTALPDGTPETANNLLARDACPCTCRSYIV